MLKIAVASGWTCIESMITIQPNTIQLRVYGENTLSYNNGMLSQTERKSGCVKGRQLMISISVIENANFGHD